MAAPTSSRPGRTLLVLGVVLAAMYGLVALGGDWKPRLGLDLQGGTSLTMQAETAEGTGEVTAEKMDEAVDIIRQRVNGTGVSEAEVSTQGGDQIVVEVPGEERGQLAEQVGQTAQLRFRLVWGQPIPATASQQPPASQPSSKPSSKPNDQPANRRVAPAWAQRGAASPAPSPSQPSDLEGAELLEWQPSDKLLQRYRNYTCPPQGEVDEDLVDNPDRGLVTCDANGVKYLLSPAIIEGTELSDASSGIPPNGGGYVVQLEFDDEASEVFGDVTAGINGTGRQFAIVLDGRVLTAPTVSNGAIRTGQAEISGNFTQESAQALANSLQYGALPLSFTTQGVSVVGPELADDALLAGVVAGLVGLLLVVVYCLLYYRALGLVVVTSLLVAGSGVYASVLLLSETMGFTLTLPGVAGLIVAIGITADSFIVFFERLRDEVREGKSLRKAVETGWARARMTIIAADTVTLLAALVLYIFAIGAVKGFAFALGLTTLVDIVVVFFFTKPLVTLLARGKFFGHGHPLSGLDAKHLGVRRVQGAVTRTESTAHTTTGGTA
ncbi:MAG TPA: protein translocase subunit SecD [Nocardioidaceae bacterium]|nr:protein translocase subunit SecD [Nocardioidaceae bacterium]